MRDIPSSSPTAGALREIADWYDAHPDIQGPTEIVLPYRAGGCTEAQAACRLARALGTFEKKHGDAILSLRRNFGGIELRFIFWRDGVCTKRVVGKRMARVPDPSAPKIEVEEEIVEWDCPPLLAGEGARA